MRRITVPSNARSPTGETNAYVYRGLLIDPAGECDALNDVVSETQIEHIAVTHTHLDHVGAVAVYAERTGATVWAQTGHIDRFTETTGLEPDRTFKDGDRVGPAHAVTTPGHARDHVGFAVPPEPTDSPEDRGYSTTSNRPTDEGTAGRRLLCGDLAMAEGSVVVGYPEGDMRAYLTSLRQVLARGFASLKPGHGPPVEDPQATIERLISHRRHREIAVQDAVVEAGASTLDQVVEHAYQKDISGVEDLASATAAAHLAKLARAHQIDRGWLARLDSPSA
ncbi:MAG: Zn-dependent hydrolase [uncultured archaeon A07HR60]|jgi:Zn-dependent hydrolases, including glyoxylases|nr:MAG: Zn-dependent hydrolase [uncultured archaeon A07HR60]